MFVEYCPLVAWKCNPPLSPKLQAELGAIVGSVPDHYNKANVVIKQVTQLFLFPHAYKNCVHTML